MGRFWHDIDRLDQRDPALIDLVARRLGPAYERYFRAEVRGLERIPPGPALFVGNHNALIMTPESVLLCLAIYRERGLVDLPFGLGHEIALRVPLVHQLVVPLGGVRASHRNAHAAFAQGHKVLVYPGSEFDAMRSWWDRDRVRFGGRTGFARLAIEAGVPIVPFVAAGAQETLFVLHDGQPLARALRLDRLLRVKAWPLSLALPWGLVLGPLPFLPWPSRILLELLPPVTFPRTGAAAAADPDYVRDCAAQVERTMQAALTRLAAARRALARGGGAR